MSQNCLSNECVVLYDFLSIKKHVFFFLINLQQSKVKFVTNITEIKHTFKPVYSMLFLNTKNLDILTILWFEKIPLQLKFLKEYNYK